MAAMAAMAALIIGLICWMGRNIGSVDGLVS